jgi:predicted nucleotide-binding protein (sugar kinase/HSP70/actin superfamily)
MMSARIGIPRALLYYRYFPLWYTFFSRLGAQVVVSSPSTRRVLEEGFKFADDDVCIPIKMVFGHVLDIKDEVDYLFIPRLLSDSRRCYCCPRLAGLPEMIKYSVPNLPPMLDPFVDEKHRSTRLSKSLSDMGRRLGHSLLRTRMAYRKARKQQDRFHRRMKAGETALDLIGSFETGGSFPDKPSGEKKDDDSMRIGVIGHPYNLYDGLLNFDLFKRLKEANASIFTQEGVPDHIVDLQIRGLKKEIYWTQGREILAAGFHFLDSKTVDGVIYLTCFSCGIDSMIEPLVNFRAKRSGVPYMTLMIDEHTGIGGFVTRLEAFLDAVRQRKLAAVHWGRSWD